jgi:hypothetical protein
MHPTDMIVLLMQLLPRYSKLWVPGEEAMLEAIQDMKYFLRTAYMETPMTFSDSRIEVKHQ